jgi:hypothetical protein
MKSDFCKLQWQVETFFDSYIIQNAETFPMDDVISDGIVSIVDAPNIQKTVVP